MSATSRIRQTPIGAYQVVVWLQTPEAGRDALTLRQMPFLDDLLARGQAMQVFDPVGQRSSMAVSATPDRDPLPPIFAVGARNYQEAAALLEELQKDLGVENCYVAPPRYVLTRASGTRDLGGKTQDMSHWGMEAVSIPPTPFDVAEMLVGVVDSGVDRHHPDLSEAVFDYINFTSTSERDEAGHGTHVCGIIAGRGVPPLRMRGVSNARLLVCKGLTYPYDATAYYRALREAADRAQIVNLSLGGAAEDPVESLIIARAIRRGVIVVAAMGNDYELGNAPHYPAALDGVIAVGAVDSKLERADFSNTGKHIRLVGPGVDVWSTIPTYRTELFKNKTGYGLCDGTSMAAPFVAGAIALILKAAGLQKKPSALTSRIATRRCPGQTKWTEELGDGMLDIAASINKVTRKRK